LAHILGCVGRQVNEARLLLRLRVPRLGGDENWDVNPAAQNHLISGSPWICESRWQTNHSESLAQQGVVEVLSTSCITEYRKDANGLKLMLSFESAERKTRRDRGATYQVPTDRLVMAIVSYEDKDGEEGVLGQPLPRASIA
jgi:hypothetical protein